MKYRFITKVLLTGLCAGTLPGCGYFSSRQVTQDALKETGKKAQSQVDKIKNATITGSELSGTDDQGRPLWKVSAKKVHALGNAQGSTTGGMPASAELTDASATLYAEGKPESQFKAPRIRLLYQEDGNVRLLLSGGVTATSQGAWSGQRGAVTMSTPQASINIKKRQLWTDHGVTATQGKGSDAIKVTSKTLLANTSLQTADLGGGVTSKTSRGTMTSPQAHWNWKSGELTAKGGVKAHNDDITLTGQHLKADTNAHAVTVSGNVTAQSPKGSAHASTVVYHWDSGQLKASGSVHLSGKGAAIDATSIQTTREMQNATATGGVRVVRGDLKVTANKATVSKMGESTFAVTGTGDVKLQNPQGNASAASATWKNGQISASGNVRLSHAGYTLRGARLTADDTFTHATLSGGAHGDFPDGGSVAAEKVVYNKGKITATGGVSGRRGVLRLRADRLESDDSGAKVELQGNVTLRNSDGTTVSAPQARYDRKKNEVYAWGGVTLRDAEHHLTQKGKTLTADLNLKQAVLTEVSGSGKINILPGKKLF